MNRKDLKTSLDELGVDVEDYSLNGDLLPGRVVLRESYDGWIVFFFDERGNENDREVFESESEACRHIFALFQGLDRYGGAASNE